MVMSVSPIAWRCFMEDVTTKCSCALDRYEYKTKNLQFREAA